MSMKMCSNACLIYAEGYVFLFGPGPGPVVSFSFSFHFFLFASSCTNGTRMQKAQQIQVVSMGLEVNYFAVVHRNIARFGHIFYCATVYWHG